MNESSQLFRITSSVVLLQMLLGGLLTFNLIDPTPHILAGFAVLLVAFVTMVVTTIRKPSSPMLRLASIILLGLLVVEIPLGFVSLDEGSAVVTWLHFAIALAIYGLAIAGTALAVNDVAKARSDRGSNKGSDPVVASGGRGF